MERSYESHIRKMKPSQRRFYEKNRLNPCKVSSCTRPRDGLSGYCKRHSVVLYQSGHPEPVRLYPKSYRPEKAEVRKVIRNNLQHPAILFGLKFFRNWFQDVQRYVDSGQECSKFVHSPGPPGCYYLYRLIVHPGTKEAPNGIQPVDCLVEVAAVWIHFSEKFSGYHQTPKYLVYTLGNRLIHMVTMGTGRHAHPPQKRIMGLHVRDTIGKTLALIHGGVKTQRKKEKALEKSFGVPLK